MNQWMKPVIFKLMLLTEAVGKKRKKGRKEGKHCLTEIHEFHSYI